MKVISFITLSLLTLSASFASAAEMNAPASATPLPSAEATLRALDPDAAHNFETLPLGSNDSRYCIPFLKIGNSSSLLRPPAIEGANADNFIIPEEFCEQDCRQFTREVLAANQVCKIPVIFHPLTVGEKQASLILQVGNEGASIQYALIGTGYNFEASAKENPVVRENPKDTSMPTDVVAKDSISKSTPDQKSTKDPSSANPTKTNPTPGDKSSVIGALTDPGTTVLNIPPILLGKAPVVGGKEETIDFSAPPTDETCAAYRERKMMQMTTAMNYAPGVTRPSSTSTTNAAETEFSRRCEELRRQRQEEARARQEAANTYTSSEAIARSCMDIYDAVQQVVSARNDVTENCSRTRQACLSAEETYQDCVHDFGTSLAGFFTFGAVNCNDEHRAKAAACDPSIFSSYGVNTIQGVRSIQCAPFNTQNPSDPVCQQHRTYHEDNCPVVRGQALDMEDRLHWYCGN